MFRALREWGVKTRPVRERHSKSTANLAGAGAGRRLHSAPFASEAWHGRIQTMTWVALGAVALLVLCLSLQQIASVDYWWQWKTGETVAQHGPPKVDAFSFTNGGTPRIEVRWAYCWMLWQVTHLLGPSAATILKTLAVLAMFGIAVRLAATRATLASTAALVAVAALACSQRLVVRPETATYLFAIVFVAGIERLQRGASRWQWVLVGVQVLWANVHGLFILGPAIAGAWLVAEWLEGRIRRGPDPDRARRLRTAAILTGSTLLASCINPYGPRVLGLAFGQAAALGNEVQKMLFVELRSPFSFGQHFTAVVFYEVLIGLAAVSALLAWGRVRVFWLLLAGSQLYLSTTAIRNLPLFCVVAIPFVVRNLAAAPLFTRPVLARLLPAGRLALAVATTGFALFQVRQLVTDRFYVHQHAINHFGTGIDTHYFPGRAADFLARTGVTGPVFTTESGGSYLIARGYRVFLDPRGDVYPNDFLSECLSLETQPTAEKVNGIIQRYDLKAFFVETLITQLVEFMAHKPGWRLVYLDSEAALFLRDDTAPEIPALQLDTQGQQWLAETRTALPPPTAYAATGFLSRVTSPAPYERLGRILFLLGQNALARPFYEDARAACPPMFTSWAMLGHLAAVQRDYRQALESYERAIAQDPKSVELRWRAGIAALQAGDSESAVRHADVAIRLAPDDWQKMALKGMAELAHDNAAVSAQWLERAIQRAPQPDASLHRNLAKAQFRLGQFPAAIASFEHAFQLDPHDAGVAVDLARAHAASGDAAAAQTWVSRALAIDPHNAAALKLTAAAPH